jgi:hypothetical protein
VALEDPSGGGVGFALCGDSESGSLEAEVDAADSGEEGQDIHFSSCVWARSSSWSGSLGAGGAMCRSVKAGPFAAERTPLTVIGDPYES